MIHRTSITFCNPGISYVEPEGGYFVVADMSPYYEEAGITKEEIALITPNTHIDDRPDVKFATWLIKEVGVGGIPM
jgi:aspartate/methionine/tyrosine aminotransferase